MMIHRRLMVRIPMAAVAGTLAATALAAQTACRNVAATGGGAGEA